MSNNQDKNRQRRIRNYVIERDGALCCYCDTVLTVETLTLDHILPDSKNGTYNTTNLTPACGPCNRKRGNQLFFEYCQQFNWPIDKLEKYRRLYFANLQIKILNIAKEEFMFEKLVIPEVAIKAASKKLKLKPMNFSEYEQRYFLEIRFEERCDRRIARSCFERLIRIIEAESADH